MTGLGRARELPAIWLGDAVRAIDALDADAATAQRILGLLGLRTEVAEFAPVANTPRLSVPPGGSVPLPQGGSVPADEPRPGPRRAGDVRPAAEPVELDGGYPPPLVERARDRPPRPPRSVRPLLLDASPDGVRLQPADLLAPGRQRAILATLCSGSAPTGEPDVAATVDWLARRSPLTTLPMLVRPTTRRGLQLLVDHGPAMTPFARDQGEVRATIARLVGPDGLDVVHFARTPLDEPGAGAGPKWKWRPYRPQPPGQPVVALTDLGALASPGDRAAVTARWLRFATLLHEAGCPFVALIPAPLSRLAPRLRAAVAVVVWDRPTGIREAALAARRAGGRVQRSPS